MSELTLTPAYFLPLDAASPKAVAERVLAMPEHLALQEHGVALGWIMRSTSKVKGGRMELGSVHDVRHMAQGAFKDLFIMLLVQWLDDLPQFVVVIDADFWAGATELQREALIFHELSHIKQDVDEYGALRFNKEGAPVWRIVSHSLEVFNDEMLRYGAWKSDISEFLECAKTHATSQPVNKTK